MCLTSTFNPAFAGCNSDRAHRNNSSPTQQSTNPLEDEDDDEDENDVPGEQLRSGAFGDLSR